MLIATLLIPFTLAAVEIDIKQLDNVTRELEQATQSPTETCIHCQGEIDYEDIKKTVVLDKKSIDVSTNYTGGDAYIIALKRTAKTPEKVVLKIEYGERVCAKMVAYQNPYSKQLGFDCMFYQTQKRSKNITLNFKKASALQGDEYQSMRIVLNKDADDRTFKHELAFTNGFFDNVDAKKSVFGDSYSFKRPAKSKRSPAVVNE